jgi:redox-sensitive bicupin YhaK (pirin superfamily)
MTGDVVTKVTPLGRPWAGADPFLFCMHHVDAYPAGNAAMGPAASLAGRDLGQDFAGKDGWNMYHGEVVPGFPGHPHRGFETVTIVRRGLIDHSDSLGATARFGNGDVQWLTAGRGIVHAEMFPLLDREGPNPLELFQIWLNLPRADKMVEPHFSMLWRDAIPTVTAEDALGRATRITLVAGRLGDRAAPPPPPSSWAARPEGDVAIWTIAMAPHAEWTLPAAQPGTHRTLYVFAGSALRIDGRDLPGRLAVSLRGDAEAKIVNGDAASEMLLLQGRPIAEPIVQHGPFVMTTRDEIVQAMTDYRATRFGGWPWPSEGPVHAREQARFAKHADGHTDVPGA